MKTEMKNGQVAANRSHPHRRIRGQGFGPEKSRLRVAGATAE
jgi:hypothetical protein